MLIRYDIYDISVKDLFWEMVLIVRNLQVGRHNKKAAHRCKALVTECLYSVQNQKPNRQNSELEYKSSRWDLKIQTLRNRAQTTSIQSNHTSHTGSRGKGGLTYIHKGAGQQSDPGETHQGNYKEQKTEGGSKNRDKTSSFVTGDTAK